MKSTGVEGTSGGDRGPQPAMAWVKPYVEWLVAAVAEIESSVGFASQR